MATAPYNAEPQSRWPDRLAWAVLALVAVVAALTFRDYGLGWDDYTHSQYGELLLALYMSGLRDTRALSFVNLYLYGGGFDMAAALLAKILPFDLFETRRLAGAAVGLIGLFLTWRIGRRAGGPQAGALALILLATCPLYYGHMFINPKDAPFAVAMAVFLLGLVRLLEEYPRPSATTLGIVGLGFGLSIGSRIMAGFGVIVAVLSIGLLMLIESWYRGPRAALVSLRRLLLALMPAAVLAYAVMGLVWPWGVAHPLNPLRAIEVFSHFFEKPWHELYGGERITPPDMPRSYVPVLMGLKLPEIFSLLAGAGLAGALVAACRSALTPRTRAVLLALALAAVLPVAVTVMARPAMYNGIRHFVFVLPPLAVAGGLAGAWIAGHAARVGPLASRVLAVVFAAGVALPVIGMVRLHPFEYAAYNQLIGGVRGAEPLYMLDYWGLAFKQAGNALRDRLAARGDAPPAGRKWKIAVCGPHPPAQIALGPTFEPTWDPKGADFALALGAFYCARLDAPILSEVVRDGVSFARAYDLRGRTVSDIFTVPPVK
ncbi:MAG TPA: glycosyltransferase family 39 protein [Xanthobacteraceae bacterium]